MGVILMERGVFENHHTDFSKKAGRILFTVVTLFLWLIILPTVDSSSAQTTSVQDSLNNYLRSISKELATQRILLDSLKRDVDVRKLMAQYDEKIAESQLNILRESYEDTLRKIYWIIGIFSALAVIIGIFGGRAVIEGVATRRVERLIMEKSKEIDQIIAERIKKIDEEWMEIRTATEELGKKDLAKITDQHSKELISRIQKLESLREFGAEFYYFKAMQILSQGISDQTIDQVIYNLKKSVEIDNNFFWAHHNLAALLDHRFKYEEAIYHAKRAIELAPENSNQYFLAYFNYAVAFEHLSRNAHQSIEEYRKLEHLAEQINPDRFSFGKIYLFMADQYASDQVKDYETAISLYDKAEPIFKEYIDRGEKVEEAKKWLRQTLNNRKRATEKK